MHFTPPPPPPPPSNNGRYGCTIVMSYIEINKAVSQWLLTFKLCVSVTWPLTCAFHIPCTHTPEIIDMHRGMCDKIPIPISPRSRNGISFNNSRNTLIKYRKWQKTYVPQEISLFLFRSLMTDNWINFILDAHWTRIYLTRSLYVECLQINQFFMHVHIRMYSLIAWCETARYILRYYISTLLIYIYIWRLPCLHYVCKYLFIELGVPTSIVKSINFVFGSQFKYSLGKWCGCRRKRSYKRV